MTYQDDCTLPTEFLEPITSEASDSLPELIRILDHAATQIERQKCLGARPDERSLERHGTTNGYKPKTVETRLDDITSDVAQAREGGLYPAALEGGLSGVQLIISDDDASLEVARKAEGGGGRRRGYPYCLQRTGSGHGGGLSG